MKGPRPRPAIERLLARVIINGDGCWIFGGGLSSTGYSQVGVGRRTKVSGHRLAYEWFKGPIPPGFELDHYRMNDGLRKAPCSRACVNPDHLEIVTRLEHNYRGDNIVVRQVARTHCPRGHAYDAENTWISKLNSRTCRACWREKARARKARATAVTP